MKTAATKVLNVAARKDCGCSSSGGDSVGTLQDAGALEGAEESVQGGLDHGADTGDGDGADEREAGVARQREQQVVEG